MFKLGAKELRAREPTKKELEKIKRFPIFFVLDNILDTFNIGSIFRLADAVSASCIYLCGKTAAPSDPKAGHKIHKASVGTWRWVPWQYASTAVSAITKLKVQSPKLKVIVLEQHKKSISYKKADYQLPLVFVAGHETHGVSKEVLKMADQIVEIPMFGVNKSLNVLVALSITTYKAMEDVV